jgi:hypothetical protein
LKELSQNQKIDLYFALAKAYEDFGKIKESFNYLELGNKLKRDIVKFNLDDERRKFERVKEIFIKVNSDKLLKNNQKSNKTNQGNKNIIFILGMPRSGTTLTEQIISSHSKIYGSGELPYLSKILKEKFFDDKNLTTSNIEKFDHTKLSEITNSYFSYLKNYEISETGLLTKLH